MTPIVSIEETQERAREDHAAGLPRDAHNMNWHATAAKVYEAQWDRCERVKPQVKQVAA